MTRPRLSDQSPKITDQGQLRFATLDNHNELFQSNQTNLVFVRMAVLVGEARASNRSVRGSNFFKHDSEKPSRISGV